MKLTEFSVKSWQFTVVLFVMLVALGAAAWTTIPRLEDPPIDFPSYTIVAVYPGANPTDLERLVVTEIEKRMDELEHVDKISSRLRDGVALIQVAFEANQDPDKKYDQVVREVNALRPKLPAELVRLDIVKGSTLDVNIIQLALVSPTASYRSLDSLGEELSDRIRRLAGVHTSERWGAPKRQVDVALDLGRLAALRIPVGQVMTAVGGESADIPAGSVETARRSFSVRSSGSYESLDEIRNTVIRGSGDRLVRVGDVADVRWGYADSTYRARYNGHRATFVTATQKAGFTVQTVRDGIVKETKRFERTLPPDVKLEYGFDQATNVSHRLERLGEDFLIAIALVMLTLLPLGWRSAVVVMISIPLSLAIGITALSWMGFTLNQMTIVGMVIALGLLVDDSIVVVENIMRFRREGHGPLEAAIKATGQIWVAVLGATATLLFAFLPLLMLPGGPGMFIRSLPAAVVVTVLASLFVSLTVVPWLSSLVLGKRAGAHGNRFLRRSTAASTPRTRRCWIARCGARWPRWRSPPR